ncbi:hypothetical protein LY89DRAFT_766965, partial [Mollisia scopiformis]
SATYDHRLRRTRHPVRSAIYKPQIGRSVVKWVTISESLLLYVFFFFFFWAFLGLERLHSRLCYPVIYQVEQERKAVISCRGKKEELHEEEERVTAFNNGYIPDQLPCRGCK